MPTPKARIDTNGTKLSSSVLTGMTCRLSAVDHREPTRAADPTHDGADHHLPGGRTPDREEAVS